MEVKKFLDCSLLEVKVDNTNDDYFMFEGYASTFGNEDHGGDVVQKGAFSDTIKELTKKSKNIDGTQFQKLMPILWQHDWKNPIGSFVDMREDEKGLWVCGIMPKDDDFVKGRVIPQMKIGAISDMSIGYIVRQDRVEKSVRYIEKADLFETSLVTIPMNEEAHVTSLKSAVYQDLPIAPKETEWDHDSAQKRHTEKNVNAQSYLIINEKENGAEYFMPVADFVDGKLMIIPKAVYSAAYEFHKGDAIKGMAEKNKQELKDNIEKYYEKMGEESPFKEQKAFKVSNVDDLSAKELEGLMRDAVAFTKQDAIKIASLLSKARSDSDAKERSDSVLRVKLDELLQTLT